MITVEVTIRCDGCGQYLGRDVDVPVRGDGSLAWGAVCDLYDADPTVGVQKKWQLDVANGYWACEKIMVKCPRCQLKEKQRCTME